MGGCRALKNGKRPCCIIFFHVQFLPHYGTSVPSSDVDVFLGIIGTESFLKSIKIGYIFANATDKSASVFAAVITNFPEENTINTTRGCTNR
mmetsp:Transcript_16143/g.29181  ORF Transcript_16143/g.29181 Transcript_16143/m.29181 type:complete len:92 (-) Transcript_16143:573-848(-)